MELHSPAKILCTYLGLVAVGIMIVSIAMLIGSEQSVFLRDAWLFLFGGIALAYSVRQIMGLRQNGFVGLRLSAILILGFVVLRFGAPQSDAGISGLRYLIGILIAAAIVYSGVEFFLRAEVRAAKDSQEHLRE